MLYWYEMKAYIFKNLFLSYFIYFYYRQKWEESPSSLPFSSQGGEGMFLFFRKFYQKENLSTKTQLRIPCAKLW